MIKPSASPVGTPLETAALPPADEERQRLRDYVLARAADTEALAARLAPLARTGDVICLWGDLGAGKTTFARGFLAARAAATGAVLDEVPSPTFTLVQAYELPDGAVWHFDLYRIEAAADTVELGMEDALAEGICLIEWPDRLGDALPAERLDVVLTFAEGTAERRARLLGARGWATRMTSREDATHGR